MWFLSVFHLYAWSDDDVSLVKFCDFGVEADHPDSRNDSQWLLTYLKSMIMQIVIWLMGNAENDIGIINYIIHYNSYTNKNDNMGINTILIRMTVAIYIYILYLTPQYGGWFYVIIHTSIIKPWGLNQSPITNSLLPNRLLVIVPYDQFQFHHLNSHPTNSFTIPLKKHVLLLLLPI